MISDQSFTCVLQTEGLRSDYSFTHVFQTEGLESKLLVGLGTSLFDNNNLNIFIQDCYISFKKKTAINAGPVEKQT